jgi:hypothetical protein
MQYLILYIFPIDAKLNSTVRHIYKNRFSICGAVSCALGGFQVLDLFSSQTFEMEIKKRRI